MRQKSIKKLMTAYGLTAFGCICAVLLGLGIVTAGGNTRAVSFGDTGTRVSAAVTRENTLVIRVGEHAVTMDGAPVRTAAETLAPARFLLPAPLSDALWLIEEAEGLAEAVAAGLSA